AWDPGMTENAVKAVLETELGNVTVVVYPDRAPLAAANFLKYVDGRHLCGSSVYRIVTMTNEPPETRHKIEVIQWGWPLDIEVPHPRIAHEPTSVTKLNHRRGSLSMARREVGTAGPGFVFCMGGDLASLDEGGGRNPDGHGFTVFGEVLDGIEILDTIMKRAEVKDRLVNRIPIRDARRL
ncbi:peptidylprolyl isomerase, partial [Rhizobiaceae sp. 2RAB30]